MKESTSAARRPATVTDELRFEIIRVRRAGNAFQKNKAERGYCEHQKPKKLVRTAEKGRNSKENAAVFRKITCFQKNSEEAKVKRSVKVFVRC